MMMTAWSSNFLLWSKGSRVEWVEAEAQAQKELEAQAAAQGGEEQNAQEQAHLPVAGAYDEDVVDIDPLKYGADRADDPRAVDRMASELEARSQQQQKFSRRRAEVPGADVTSINDRNKHFNKKLSRAFDKYTVEMRQNLERGTAI